MKATRTRPLFAAFAVSAALFSASVFASGDPTTPVLKQFNVKGTQYSLLRKFFWKRLSAKAGFKSCVRRLYSNLELLEKPLGDEAYGILAFFKNVMTPEKRNTFAFLNSSAEPWKCEVKGGYCMGITALARDLNLLLIFDPNQSRSKLPVFANDQEKSEYFENLLWNVFSKKEPTFVPGFADLHSFSSDPIVKNVFHAAVPWNWADLATIPDVALGVLSKSRRHVKEPEIIEQMKNLLTARRKGYNATNYLGGVEGSDEWAFLPPKDGPTLDRPFSEEAVWEAMGRGRRLFDSAPAATAGKPKPVLGGALAGALDSDHTFIHVVQVIDITEIGPRSWKIKTIDPNGHAPGNIGLLSVDLDAKQPIVWVGVTHTLELNSFGQLPGDREHLDEIVANLILFEKKNPGVFVETDPVPKN